MEFTKGVNGVSVERETEKSPSGPESSDSPIEFDLEDDSSESRKAIGPSVCGIEITLVELQATQSQLIFVDVGMQRRRMNILVGSGASH